MFAFTLGRRIIFALKQQVWVQAPKGHAMVDSYVP
jgi:hypothetical protein